MIKRVLLFLATLLLVVLTVFFMIGLFDLTPYLVNHGIRPALLGIFCISWGCAGAFLTLLLSKFFITLFLKLHIVNPRFAKDNEKKLLDCVYRHAINAGLTHMPVVGIYRSPELNAFAVGSSRNNALIAISSGLLINMRETEREGVIAHEISHIANGDMVTLTLMQGVLNAFGLFLTAIISYVISLSLASGNRSKEENSRLSMLSYTLLSYALYLLLTLPGGLIVTAFSRHRELVADAGSARLVGRDAMIATLRQLQAAKELEEEKASTLALLKIAQKPKWLSLLSTHPTFEHRIAYLIKSGPN